MTVDTADGDTATAVSAADAGMAVDTDTSAFVAADDTHASDASVADADMAVDTAVLASLPLPSLWTMEPLLLPSRRLPSLPPLVKRHKPRMILTIVTRTNIPSQKKTETQKKTILLNEPNEAEN